MTLNNHSESPLTNKTSEASPSNQALVLATKPLRVSVPSPSEQASHRPDMLRSLYWSGHGSSSAAHGFAAAVASSEAAEIAALLQAGSSHSATSRSGSSSSSARSFCSDSSPGTSRRHRYVYHSRHQTSQESHISHFATTMNHSNALFHSHLMQQFAAAARTQLCPPLALAAESGTRRQNSGSFSTRTSGDTSSRPFTNQTHGVPHSTTRSVLYASTSATDSSVNEDSHLSRIEQDSHEDHKEQDEVHNTEEHIIPSINQSLLATSLQSLMKSCRTAINFELMNPEELRKALDRAIACAQAAPNHHRTEPFFFKRLMKPSPSTERLCDIAAQVVFTKKCVSDPLSAQAHVDRKRDKWNQIPAFLVTLVANQPPVGDAADEYSPLDFLSPETERQLEDYASACAAIQNILLSLHAERIGTKWVTGSVVKTLAFRSLFGLEKTDRVVGLIMVGSSSSSRVETARRYRKRPEELVEDLL